MNRTWTIPTPLHHPWLPWGLLRYWGTDVHVYRVTSFLPELLKIFCCRLPWRMEVYLYCQCICEFPTEQYMCIFKVEHWIVQSRIHFAYNHKCSEWSGLNMKRKEMCGYGRECLRYHFIQQLLQDYGGKNGAGRKQFTFPCQYFEMNFPLITLIIMSGWA